MGKTILVAGATGDIGGRVVRELIKRGADVRGLVRPTSDPAKVAKLEEQGAKIARPDMSDKAALTEACKGVTCIVSTLAGLHDVIVVDQSALLDAAIAAGVPRFIPSDFASDFTKQAKGENRNFDLRKEFHEYLDKQTSVKATSILNGGFAELLSYNIPFLNFKNQTVGYWGDPDWKVDFSTKDNVAAFTAAAALDDDAPRVLRIASFQVSANEMVKIASEVLHAPYQLVRLGSVAELAEQNKRDRAANPAGENELYAKWQQSQYMQSMFSTHLEPLDNGRYTDIQWTPIQEVIGRK